MAQTRSLKSTLILFAFCLAISAIVTLFSICSSPKMVEVKAIVKEAKPTTIDRTKTTSRSGGRTSSVTIPEQGTLLKVEFIYNDSLYTKEIKRFRYAHRAYTKGDTIRLNIDPDNPSKE